MLNLNLIKNKLINQNYLIKTVFTPYLKRSDKNWVVDWLCAKTPRVVLPVL